MSASDTESVESDTNLNTSSHPTNDEVREKRLAQLAQARQVSIENKLRRSEPARRRKAIQKDLEEKLYHRDMAEVERLENLVKRAEALKDPTENRTEAVKSKKRTRAVSETPPTSYMDHLINQLYS